MRGGVRPSRDLYDMVGLAGTLPAVRPNARPSGPLCISLSLRGYQGLENVQYNAVFFISIMGAVYVVRGMVHIELAWKSDENLNPGKTQSTAKKRERTMLKTSRREGVIPREHAQRQPPRPRDLGSTLPPSTAIPCTAGQNSVSTTSSERCVDTYSDGEVSCYRTLADVHKLGDAHEEHC